MNPYEPPQPNSIQPWHPSDTFEPITVRFPNTAEHMLQCIARFRPLRSTTTGFMHYPPMILRSTSIIFLLGVYVSLTMFQRRIGPARFWQPTMLTYLLPILILVPILYALMSGRLLRWRLKQTLARSQNQDAEVTFSLADNGVQVTYPNCESKLTWNAFTQAAAFDDGALLVQAQGFYWLPYQAIEGDYGQERILHLLQAKIPKLIDRRKNATS